MTANPSPGAGEVRLADVLGALSLAVDLGLGQPMGHVARATVVASRIGDRVGMSAAARSTLVHVAMMGWVGCIADSREAAAWFGDDIGYRAGVYDLDMAPLPFLGYLLRRAGREDPLPRRAAKVAGVLIDGGRSAQQSLRAHCQVTSNVAARLDLSPEVCGALGHIFDRWDGKGLPPGVGGADVPVPVRVWQLADVAEVHYQRGGAEAVAAVATARRGTAFDPELVDELLTGIDPLFDGLGPESGWDAMAELEPTPALSGRRLDGALEVVADWVDLKSPWFSGHSRAVAGLAENAANHTGLDPARVAFVRRAGLLHDLGRTGVPNTLWDKPGPLTASERERIRLHSYYTERMLAHSPALAECGAVAAMAHERLDGSGYHRGLAAGALPVEARLLAAADTFRTKTEDRPHRRALPARAAAAHLAEEAASGRLDQRAVDAVLAVQGQQISRTSHALPAGLTPREAEVLGHIARGATNRQVAGWLGISPKTVGNHVEHIYAKTGVSTRAAATLFAMEHRLVDGLG
ncbi:MAG TPA: HD domain-containing phosphohydrolase [Nocardioidaceae bacterium]|nr:HD domain-containing phosphohydrolase [Nocardioidaceae bacterium]